MPTLGRVGLCLVPRVLACATGDASGRGAVAGSAGTYVATAACTPALAHDGLLVQGGKRMCVRLFGGLLPAGCQEIIAGGTSGGRMQLAGLMCASPRWCELALGLLRPYMAVMRTGWLAMVRRRSTVRFRKGAPQNTSSEA